MTYRRVHLQRLPMPARLFAIRSGYSATSGYDFALWWPRDPKYADIKLLLELLANIRCREVIKALFPLRFTFRRFPGEARYLALELESRFPG